METKRHALIIGIALLLCSFALPSCASGNVPQLPDTLPVKRDIFTVINRLNQVAGTGKLTLKPVGTIRYSQFETSMWALNFKPPDKVKHVVLLTGGVHGNEPAGTEMLLQLAESMSREPEKYDGFYFDIIPLVNPWGWVFDTRHNCEGIDINRDFASFNSLEARLIREFTRGKSYDLVIDFHEDPSAQGFYLYQNAAPDTTVGRRVIAAVRKADFPIEQNVSMVILKTDDGLIDAPLWSLWYMQATRQISCPSYFRLENGSTAFTIETPKNLVWDGRLKMHRVALNEILGSYTTMKPAR